MQSQFEIIKPSPKKSDAREEYAAFLEHWQISQNTFPFEWKAAARVKSGSISWKAVSWGWYECEKKVFRVYLAFSGDGGKLRRQVSWVAMSDRVLNATTESDQTWAF